MQPFDEINWLDQAVHMITGCCIVLVVSAFAPVWAGFMVSMVAGGVRERLQHAECHNGCVTDMAFWGVGSILGSLIGLFL